MLLPARIVDRLKPTHMLDIVFADGETVVVGDREAKALFMEPTRFTANPQIAVAMRGHSYAKSIEYLAHELAHYTQWRDTGRTHEIGIKARTRTILRMLDADTLLP